MHASVFTRCVASTMTAADGGTSGPGGLRDAVDGAIGSVTSRQKTISGNFLCCLNFSGTTAIFHSKSFSIKLLGVIQRPKFGCRSRRRRSSTTVAVQTCFLPDEVRLIYLVYLLNGERCDRTHCYSESAFATGALRASDQGKRFCLRFRTATLKKRRHLRACGRARSAGSSGAYECARSTPGGRKRPGKAFKRADIRFRHRHLAACERALPGVHWRPRAGSNGRAMWATPLWSVRGD